MKFLVLFACAILTTTAGAQASTSSRHGAALDLTVGLNTSDGGNYTDRGAVGAEITFVPPHSGSFIGALTAGGRTSIANGDKCVISADPHRQCVPQFPSLGHIGLLGGVERVSGPGTLRAMAGPAYFVDGSRSALGAQLHLDAAVGISRIALVVAGRESVALFSGDHLALSGIEVGLRLR